MAIQLKEIDFEIKSINRVRLIVSDILQEIIVPEFKKYKIPFPKNDKEQMASSIFTLLKKELVDDDLSDYPTFFMNMVESIADDVVEYCIEEYLYKHKKMIPAKNSKERTHSGVSSSEQTIIFGARFYDEFEDPIIDIIRRRWELFYNKQMAKNKNKLAK